MRRQTDGGESRQTIREHVDMEGGTLGFSTMGTEGLPVAGHGIQKTTAATSSTKKKD